MFAERLEGMVRALSGAADQLQRAEPVSAHPHKIQYANMFSDSFSLCMLYMPSSISI